MKHFEKWPASEIEKLKILAQEGKSSADIARIMEKTRNSIIGICRRNKIQFHKKNGVQIHKMKQEEKNKTPEIVKPLPKLPPPIPQPIKEQITGGISLNNATPFQCRWIIGDPKNLMICGDKTTSFSNWCPSHHAIVRPRKAA